MSVCFVEVENTHSVAETIMWPVDLWPGNCYAVACAVLEAGIVAGKAQYGHWLGEVNPHCKEFSHKNEFQRHGWILGVDGLIYDYTRWVFECAEPYVWIGDNDGTYDMGGNKFREKMGRNFPCPEFNPDQKTFDMGEHFEETEIRGFLFDMMEMPEVVSIQQVGWLSSQSLNLLGDFAKPIYEWVINEVGFSGFIPLDNRREVLGK